MAEAFAAPPSRPSAATATSATSLERIYRDVRVCQIYEGTLRTHQASVSSASDQVASHSGLKATKIATSMPVAKALGLPGHQPAAESRMEPSFAARRQRRHQAVRARRRVNCMASAVTRKPRPRVMNTKGMSVGSQAPRGRARWPAPASRVTMPFPGQMVQRLRPRLMPLQPRAPSAAIGRHQAQHRQRPAPASAPPGSRRQLSCTATPPGQ